MLLWSLAAFAVRLALSIFLPRGTHKARASFRAVSRVILAISLRSPSAAAAMCCSNGSGSPSRASGKLACWRCCTTRSRHCAALAFAGQLQPSHLQSMHLKYSSRRPGESEVPGIQNHSDVPYAMSPKGTRIMVSNAAAGGATEDAAACEV